RGDRHDRAHRVAGGGLLAAPGDAGGLQRIPGSLGGLLSSAESDVYKKQAENRSMWRNLHYL
ncbi:hypothetical protein Q2393_23775, partial [Escherichia coli]|nr:hypothetical protein [Escherichia coli]